MISRIEESLGLELDIFVDALPRHVTSTDSTVHVETLAAMSFLLGPLSGALVAGGVGSLYSVYVTAVIHVVYRSTMAFPT